MRILSVRRIATRRACHRSPPEGAPAPVMVSSQRGHRRVRQATDLSVLFSYTFRAGPAGGFPRGGVSACRAAVSQVPSTAPTTAAGSSSSWRPGPARWVDPGRYLRPDRCTSVGVIRAPGPPGGQGWFQRAVVAGLAVMVGSSWGFLKGCGPRWLGRRTPRRIAPVPPPPIADGALAELESAEVGPVRADRLWVGCRRRKHRAGTPAAAR